MWNEPRRHWLYTLSSSDGAVLYVGVTCSPEKRLRWHYRTGWRGIRERAVRASWRHLGVLSRREAVKIEAGAIRELRPEFNRKGVA